NDHLRSGVCHVQHLGKPIGRIDIEAASTVWCAPQHALLDTRHRSIRPAVEGDVVRAGCRARLAVAAALSLVAPGSTLDLDLGPAVRAAVERDIPVATQKHVCGALAVSGRALRIWDARPADP